MTQFHPSWYLIYTRSKQEKKVAEQLSRYNIGNYLPLKREKRKWKDRLKTLEVPLFPSYVFVFLEDSWQYTVSLQLEGMCYYVKFDNKITHVSQQEIDNIRLLTSVNGELDVSYEHIRPGKKYLIQEGPLSGLSCEIVDFKGHHKFLVRIEILQRAILMDVPAIYIGEAILE
ncbi:UpxY family transcription antiterminator [Chitinophaga qingshengii]|uniref:UpxY family transcription antiterminator n=1 Tax=Chitinophaga qingshengii TaxID=1569794 RepID=A0ABR7TVJ7_9BACT|nr:UpxY family transcription antiterminator [Chitinophaga qingshengii]MBC9934520.1 UpxY family transcription antiterminator [Chitinophaga qingshengii]